jgi:S-DNA-T family DNA segregation ATPase FtsK/SpoIIIE
VTSSGATFRSEDNQEQPSGYGRLFVVLICAMLAVCLYFFNPDDIDYFAGGITGTMFPINVFGKCGAYIAWGLVLTFGLAAYVTIGLIFICAMRRLLYNKYVSSVSWDYLAALILFTLSLSLLFATHPDSFTNWTSRLNIRTLPGGVVGRKEFSALRVILNSAGSVIVASCGVFASLLYLWYCDWAGLFKRIFSRSGSKASEPTEVDDEPMQEVSHERISPQVVEVAPPSVVELEPAVREVPKAEAVVEKPKAASPAKPAAHVKGGAYKLPTLDLLDKVDTATQTAASASEIEHNQEALQKMLDAFGVEATVVSSVAGPQVTLIKISMAPGVLANTIQRYEANIMMALQATSIRILTPIPGENFVGVEVPNKVMKPVSVRSLLEDPLWIKSKYHNPLMLGKNISGKTMIIDLASAPHLLIAGATGSGKSVCMNVLILSMLFRYGPDDLKLILIDPKMVEFAAYKKLPHLLTPVIVETDKVAAALKWAVREMDRRLALFAIAGKLDLKSFNTRSTEGEDLKDSEGDPLPEKLPYIVVIIDELADIMSTSKQDVETALSRLAAKARAAGIHVIIATQRPDVKVITGTIKSNFPKRIAFQVAGHVDSQTILDGKGAEALLGKGDMLYKSGLQMERIQGAMAKDEERNKVVDYIASQRPQEFEDIFVTVEDPLSEDGGMDLPLGNGSKESGEDPLYDKAVHIVISEKRTSASYLQRRLGIGFNKAATLIEMMEKNGIVSAPDPSNRNVRELLVTSAPNQEEDAADDDFGDDDDK